jgi:hypothetical protein
LVEISTEIPKSLCAVTVEVGMSLEAHRKRKSFPSLSSLNMGRYDPSACKVRVGHEQIDS